MGNTRWGRRSLSSSAEARFALCSRACAKEEEALRHHVVEPGTRGGRQGQAGFFGAAAADVQGNAEPEKARATTAAKRAREEEERALLAGARDPPWGRQLLQDRGPHLRFGEPGRHVP